LRVPTMKLYLSTDPKQPFEINPSTTFHSN
jgi:hypothetical protein